LNVRVREIVAHTVDSTVHRADTRRLAVDNVSPVDLLSSAKTDHSVGSGKLRPASDAARGEGLHVR
jgi:hypothetical protein